MPSEEPWRDLYPFESRWFTIDGLRYHYLDEGAGETLLLVHGNPTWSFHWRELIRTLRGRYRVIAVDHMGCGLSDKPRRYPYRLEQHVDNVVALVKKLDLRQVTLVAQDWGGAIGVGAALELSDRFSRFVLSNTAAFRSQQMPLRIRVCRTPGLGQFAVQGLNGFVRAALRMAVAKPQRLTPAIKAGYLAPYDNWANRVATHRFVLDIPMHPGHPSYRTLQRIEEGLPSLGKFPVLLIWGMQDWCFTPHFLERFLEFLPKAEVHRINDAGHWVIEDAPERMLPLIQEFLSAHPLMTHPTAPEGRH